VTEWILNKRFNYKGFEIIEDDGLLIGIGTAEVNDRMRRIVLMARHLDFLKISIDSMLTYDV